MKLEIASSVGSAAISALSSLQRNRDHKTKIKSKAECERQWAKDIMG